MAQTRLNGFIVVLIATVLWSTAGLFVRLAALDTWSIVAWRSLFAFITLGLFWLVVERDKPAAIKATFSPPGFLAVAIGVVSGISYVVSLQLTTVANVMTVYAALPFIAAIIAFFAFNERATYRFVICGLVASVGVAVMMMGVMTTQDSIGILAAFVMTAGFAASLVQAKRYPELDMTLVTVAAAGVSAMIAFPLTSSAAPPNASQLLACALLGALTTGVANVMSMVGGRMIRSGEAGLISLLDVPLGPLWVWLFFSESVETNTIIGGSIVLAAVVSYLARARRDYQLLGADPRA
ncbi:DMT family transporter [Rhizobium sp. CC-YZS058]|uniref:DMT family transporter n=1 Tax=Rhizobium sp. CC-YZS058 TaxID=3042153 RepID=UPI002B05EAAA|nr:DMT family transporter [Rhizobium sp. CC-YZS058]MEA3533242.1 DMT family transporter [Rhizobium sp. CC-YZS058]